MYIVLASSRLYSYWRQAITGDDDDVQAPSFFGKSYDLNLLLGDIIYDQLRLLKVGVRARGEFN